MSMPFASLLPGAARSALELAASLAADAHPYVVGGAIRDLLLRRRVKDLDISVEHGAAALGRSIARSLGGSFFFLSEGPDGGGHRGEVAVRVVAPGHRGGLQIDVTERPGPVEDDLRRRDLTINAMAIQPDAVTLLLSATQQPDEVPLVDPCGGLADLRARLLRPPLPTAFVADPVRVLRTVRFMASLAFALAPGVDELLRAAAPFLPNSAPERLRDELMCILDCPGAAKWLRLLCALGALHVLLPELDGLPRPTRSHTLRSVAALSGPAVWRCLPADLRPAATAYLRRAASPLYSQAAVLRLALLLHHVGPLAGATSTGTMGQRSACAVAACRRLRLPSAAVAAVRASVRYWELPCKTPLTTPTALLRAYRSTGRHSAAVALVALAHVCAGGDLGAAMEGQEDAVQSCLALLRASLLPGCAPRPQAIVSGADLMRELGIPPGPVVGRLLGSIEEAQVEGRVTTPADAIDLARSLLRGTHAGS